MKDRKWILDRIKDCDDLIASAIDRIGSDIKTIEDAQKARSDYVLILDEKPETKQ